MVKGYTTLSKQLMRVQRAVLIGIWGALRLTPTIVLNAIYHVAPVDIVGWCLTAKCTIRLREAGYMRDFGQVHIEIYFLKYRLLQKGVYSL